MEKSFQITKLASLTELDIFDRELTVRIKYYTDVFDNISTGTAKEGSFSR